jgi:FtsH-binding integral membrane protein
MNQYQPGHTGTIEHASAQPVAYADTPTRLAFLRKVYAIFGASMVLWMGTTLVVATTPSLMGLAMPLMTSGFIGFMLIMAGMFLLLRLTANSYPMNVVGIGLFSVLEGFLTAPLVYLALARGNEVAMAALQQGAFVDSVFSQGGGIVTQAFVITAAVFTGLTAYALTTKRDFLWMRGALWMGFFALVGIMLLSFLGIGEGLMGWGFSLAWVVLMGGFVLYDTQNILKRYPESMAVSAAATLLIDFIIMFKHILMLLMRRD